MGTPGGEWNHRDSRGRGRGDVERLVNGRPATPQVIVVHARQVVVDERIRVHHFDGCRQTTGIANATRCPMRREDQ
jgi:hypothetical protein